MRNVVKMPITLNEEQAREIALSIEKIQQLAYIVSEAVDVLKEGCLDDEEKPLIRQSLVDIIGRANADMWGEHLEAINEKLWGSHLSPYAFGVGFGFRELEFSLTETEQDEGDESTSEEEQAEGGES